MNAKRLFTAIWAAMLLAFIGTASAENQYVEFATPALFNVGAPNEYIVLNIPEDGTSLAGYILLESNSHTLSGIADKGELKVYTQAKPANSAGGIELEQAAPIFDEGEQVTLKYRNRVVDLIDVPVSTPEEKSCALGNVEFLPGEHHPTIAGKVCINGKFRSASLASETVTPAATINATQATMTETPAPQNIALDVIVTTTPAPAVVNYNTNITGNIVVAWEDLEIVDCTFAPIQYVKSGMSAALYNEWNVDYVAGLLNSGEEVEVKACRQHLGEVKYQVAYDGENWIADRDVFTSQRPVVTATPVATQAPVTQAVPVTQAQRQPSNGSTTTNVVATAPAADECSAIHSYPLAGLPEVATSGSFLHVEYYMSDGQPEKELVLPTGRYIIDHLPKGGWVWEYAPTCTLEQVQEQVEIHIHDRLTQDPPANNAGWGDSKELFGDDLHHLDK